MTLIEKFHQWLKTEPFSSKERPTLREAQCEQIADDYAIEFSEWCTYYRDKNRNLYGDMLHAKSKYDETYTTKQLLEIFKKEKGL